MGSGRGKQRRAQQSNYDDTLILTEVDDSAPLAELLSVELMDNAAKSVVERLSDLPPDSFSAKLTRRGAGDFVFSNVTPKVESLLAESAVHLTLMSLSASAGFGDKIAQNILVDPQIIQF